MAPSHATPIVIGVLLLIGAVAGFVIVPEHRLLVQNGEWWQPSYVPGRSGWSHTVYDAAQIGTWAMLIAGGVLIAVGLISYARPSSSH